LRYLFVLLITFFVLSKKSSKTTLDRPLELR